MPVNANLWDAPILGSSAIYVQNVSTTAAYLIYNFTGMVGSPNLVLSIQEADPNNPGTVIVGGESNTTTISSNGTGMLALTNLTSPCLLVSWTLSGGTFSDVSLSLTEKSLGTAVIQIGAVGPVGQGSPGLVANAWPVEITDGINVLGTSSHPIAVTGSISASNPSVGTTGTTAPTSATELGFISSGNLIGISSSNPLPITGSISASNPSVGTNGSAIPSSSTQIAGSDGTNLQELLVESSSHPNLRVGLYNGSTEATITGSNALKVDGSAVTQPISGTVTANAGTGTFAISATSLPLPTSAATASNQTTLGTQTTEINDGTHTATIKAASTAAGATDTALVVAISPNNTIAATQSGVWTTTVTQGTSSNLNANVSVQATGVFSHTLNQDGSGNLGVNIENSPAVTVSSGSVSVSSIPSIPAGSAAIGSVSVSNFPSSQAVTGTITADQGGSWTVTQEPLLPTSARLSSVSVSVSSSGNNTLIAGITSQTIRVFKLFLVFSTATTAVFQDGSSTALDGNLNMSVGGAIVLDLDTEPWFVTSSGNGFVLNLGTAGLVGGRIYYTQS